MENNSSKSKEMTHLDKEFLNEQYGEIKNLFEEIRKDYRSFNDIFLPAVQSAIEDQFSKHKKEDVELLKSLNDWKTKIEKRLYVIEGKLGLG